MTLVMKAMNSADVFAYASGNVGDMTKATAAIAKLSDTLR